jgi:hypothetical protein
MTVKDLIAELSEIPGDYEIEVALSPMTPEDEEVDLDEDPSAVSAFIYAAVANDEDKLCHIFGCEDPGQPPPGCPCGCLENAASPEQRTAQITVLNQRVQEVGQQQPEILTLREKLLALGGVEIVALPPLTHGLDDFVPSLAELGTVMEGTVTHKDMEPNNCHLNATKLWKERKEGSGLIGIGTGYALSDDGLWRGHSWALTKGWIIETTLPTVKYFGVGFTGEGADLFVNMSAAAHENEVSL